MGPNGRSRQVQPAPDLAQVADAAARLSSLLEQVPDSWPRFTYPSSILIATCILMVFHIPVPVENYENTFSTHRSSEISSPNLTSLYPPVQNARRLSASTCFKRKATAQVLQYVEEVLADRTEPNNAAGRQLLELVHALPSLSADSFADAFASSVKDLLMVDRCTRAHSTVHSARVDTARMHVSARMSDPRLCRISHEILTRDLDFLFENRIYGNLRPPPVN